jgi:hypothetical protein
LARLASLPFAPVEEDAKTLLIFHYTRAPM